MIKTILIITCFSLIFLVIGIFIGHRMNPIKKETVEEMNYVTNKLEEIKNITNVDVNLIRTQSFVFIFLEILTNLKKADPATAINIIESSLSDIRSEITKEIDDEKFLNDAEKQIIKLIDDHIKG